jgi:hypothetical protein
LLPGIYPDRCNRLVLSSIRVGNVHRYVYFSFIREKHAGKFSHLPPLRVRITNKLIPKQKLNATAARSSYRRIPRFARDYKYFPEWNVRFSPCQRRVYCIRTNCTHLTTVASLCVHRGMWKISSFAILFIVRLIRVLNTTHPVYVRNTLKRFENHKSKYTARKRCIHTYSRLPTLNYTFWLKVVMIQYIPYTVYYGTYYKRSFSPISQITVQHIIQNTRTEERSVV